MALTALLFAHHGGGTEGEPPAMRRVAGLSVIERQVRQARLAGATRVIVIVERMPPLLARTLYEIDVVVARASSSLLFADDETLLVIEDALVVDDRAIAATLGRSGTALAVWKGRAAHPGAQRIDPSTHWAGVAVYPAALVVDVLSRLGDWDLQETLLRSAFANDARPARIDIATLDTCVPALARDVPILWYPIRSADDARRAQEAQLSAARASPGGWPGRHAYRAVRDAAVKSLVETRLTAGFIVTACLIAGIGSTFAFTIGWFWLGLLLALLAGPIGEIGGTLSRVRQEVLPRWTLLASGIVEGTWYLALAGHLALSRDPVGPLALAALILFASFGMLAHRAIFQHLTGRRLDDAGDVERRIRLLGSGRDANLWSLLPFAAFGAWYAGLVWLAAYSVITAIAWQARFFARLIDYGRAESPGIAANLAATRGLFPFNIDTPPN